MPLALSRVDWSEWSLSVLLVPACAYVLAVPWDAGGWVGAPWLLMHSMCLLVHEAGHFLFRWFGEWMMFAGGSILQLALPALIGWSALTWGNRVVVQLGFFWLGQSFVDVSVYAADAQARTLPLIGGLGDDAHDWYRMLEPLDLLGHAELIAAALVACGVAAWAFALAAPRWV